MNRCPLCRRKTQVLHANKLIRELARVADWTESAVCIDCYDVLDAYRRIALPGSGRLTSIPSTDAPEVVR
jgi:hypothetical protein